MGTERGESKTIKTAFGIRTGDIEKKSNGKVESARSNFLWRVERTIKPRTAFSRAFAFHHYRCA